MPYIDIEEDPVADWMRRGAFAFVVVVSVISLWLAFH